MFCSTLPPKKKKLQTHQMNKKQIAEPEDYPDNQDKDLRNYSLRRLFLETKENFHFLKSF